MSESIERIYGLIIIIIIIIIIITLFESQIILAEHECCTNWGDCKSNKSNQIKCWFLRRGENRSSRRKTSRSRVENQQTQPTYDAGSGNRTRDTLVEGERSHHYTNPALPPETDSVGIFLITIFVGPARGNGRRLRSLGDASVYRLVICL